VGVAAIEMVKAEGAISIAVTHTAAKKAHLLKLGADHVIVTDEEDLFQSWFASVKVPAPSVTSRFMSHRGSTGYPR